MNTNTEQPKNNVKHEIFGWLKVLILSAAIALFLNNFIIANARVPSPSMENTIMTGERLVGFRLSYVFSEPQRGDIVIFRFPDDEKKFYIKRIIGLPGDVVDIKEGQVYLNDSDTPLQEDYIKEAMVPEAEARYEVPEGAYFCLGDNRNGSKDSRRWNNPYVYRNKIIAKAIFSYFPKIKLLH